MPTPYPQEFRRDVLAVACQGDQSIAQVARSFRIPGADLEVENRELRRRTKQLVQENEIPRRATAYFARDALPR